MDPRRVALATLVTVIASGCTEAVAPDPTGKALELVVEGLRSPVFLTAAGDDRLFVVEKAGRILVLHDDVPHPTPFLDISTSVSSNGERSVQRLGHGQIHASNPHGPLEVHVRQFIQGRHQHLPSAIPFGGQLGWLHLAGRKLLTLPPGLLTVLGQEVGEAGRQVA
ncbi:MAG: hypothetical protein O2958_08295 [Gemmatimonadetes bacterium]|nr:hypothetical protein [Gemmatimonadota bacterium]